MTQQNPYGDLAFIAESLRRTEYQVNSALDLIESTLTQASNDLSQISAALQVVSIQVQRIGQEAERLERLAQYRPGEADNE